MKNPYTFLTLALMILVGTAFLPAQTQKLGVASRDEYKVYEALLARLNQIPVEDPRVVISDVTLNSKCGPGADPNPNLNGCSFLWIKPDTPGSVKQKLTARWGQMENSTWEDFEAKNAESVRLFEPIATPWKHKLTNAQEDFSGAWKSPDLMLFLSRVGFNKYKTEAVVYVLVFSYLAAGGTGGQYVLLHADKSDQWKPSAYVGYFSMGEAQTPR